LSIRATARTSPGSLATPSDVRNDRVTITWTRADEPPRSQDAAPRGPIPLGAGAERPWHWPCLSILTVPGTSQRSKTTWSPWAREYARTPERYVFGTAPSDFALEVARLIRPGDYVLDLGCGEGRDSVFFAGLGGVVTRVDVSAEGIAKARRLATARDTRALWGHGS